MSFNVSNDYARRQTAGKVADDLSSAEQAYLSALQANASEKDLNTLKTDLESKMRKFTAVNKILDNIHEMLMRLIQSIKVG